MLSRLVHPAERVRSGVFPLGVRVTLLVALASCGGDNGTNPTNAGPQSLQVVAGDKQTGAAGAVLPQLITLTALDAAGQPVNGAIVSFDVSAGGGHVSVARDTAKVLGRVSTLWTLGTVAGDAQTLKATVVGVAGSTSVPAKTVEADLTATVVAGAPAVLNASATVVSAHAGQVFSSPIVVTMTDQYGNRSSAAGTAITVRAEDARTTLVGTTTMVTDANGAATFNGLFATGHAGTGALLFESGALTAARVPLTLSPGSASKVATTTGTVQGTAGASGPPVVVLVTDAWDNAVAGAQVLFSIDGVAVLGSATSDNNGLATLSSWKVPAIGNYTITANLSGTTAFVHQALVSTTGTPTSIVPIFVATSAQAGAFASLSFTVLDAGGNPVPLGRVDWSSAGQTGTTIADINGVATLSAPVPTVVGSATVTFSFGGAQIGSVSVPVIAGPLAKILILTSPTNIAAGSTLSIVARATDAYDNVTSNVSLTTVMSPAGDDPAEWLGGSFASHVVTTGTDGTAQFDFATGPYAGPYSLLVKPTAPPAPGAPPIDQPTTTVYATAAHGTFVFGSNPAAPCTFPKGTSSSFMVFTFAANGHGAGGVPITLTLAAGNGVLNFIGQSLTVTTDAGGSAFFMWTLPSTAGTYVLSATAPAEYLAAHATMTCTATP